MTGAQDTRRWELGHNYKLLVHKTGTKYCATPYPSIQWAGASTFRKFMFWNKNKKHMYIFFCSFAIFKCGLRGYTFHGWGRGQHKEEYKIQAYLSVL